MSEAVVPYANTFACVPTQTMLESSAAVTVTAGTMDISAMPLDLALDHSFPPLCPLGHILFQ